MNILWIICLVGVAGFSVLAIAGNIILKHISGRHFLMQYLRKNGLNPHSFSRKCLDEIVQDSLKYLGTMHVINDLRGRKTRESTVLTDDLMRKASVIRIFMLGSEGYDCTLFQEGHPELYATLVKYGHVCYYEDVFTKSQHQN